MKPESKVASVGRDVTVPRLSELLGQREFYVSIFTLYVHAAGFQSKATNFAALLRTSGDLLIPSARPGSRARLAHFLSPEEIPADPGWRDLARELGPDHQLCVAVWRDGTVALRAARPDSVPLAPWWELFMHDQAKHVRELAGTSAERRAAEGPTSGEARADASPVSVRRVVGRRHG